MVSPPVLDPDQLSIHGAKLGWTLKQIEEVHGRSRKEYGMTIWGPATQPKLAAQFDESGHANFLAGSSLNYSGQTLLEKGMVQSRWAEEVGYQFPAHEWIVPACGLSRPSTNIGYHHRPLNLTIAARSSGLFWKSEPKAARFILHKGVLEAYYDELVPYKGMPEPPAEEVQPPALVRP